MYLETELLNLVSTGRSLVENGLVRGVGGNVSVRWREQCYISPAGARLDRLSVADFVPLVVEGGNTWQLRRASREYAMHLACYRARPDVNAVLHVHPPNCVALGCAGLPLRAISPDFYAAVGVEVPLLPFLAPTTTELAEAVGAQLADHDAVLLRNHGLILGAADCETALTNILLVEEAARIVLLAHAAVGSCSYLTAEEIENLEQVAEHYRRPDRRAQSEAPG